MSDLDDLQDRLQVLWSTPEAYREGTHWVRRVWLRTSGLGDRPLRTVALRAFRALPSGHQAADQWMAHRQAVLDEFRWNLKRTEAVARASKVVESAELGWLFAVLRWTRSMDASLASPHARASVTQGLASAALLARSEGEADRALLGGVDSVLDEAAAEHSRIERRQRLLLAARRILIDAESSSSGGPAWSERRSMIAFELAQLRQLKSSGVDARVDLRHQLRQHIERGETSEAARASAALMYLQPPSNASKALNALIEASGRATWPSISEGAMSEDVLGAVERGYRRAQEHIGAALETAVGSRALELRRRRTDLEHGSSLELLQSVLGAEGIFDVGGGLEREEFDAETRTTRHVPFPTPSFDLEPARGPADVPSSLIEDPRLVLYHLASRRLLHRQYIHSETRPERRRGVRATVRFYLLDGSSSMHGARARMRDAILISELASLVSRLQSGGRTRNLLFYRFFTTEAQPTQRVTTSADALGAIEDVLFQAQSGGTDIQAALLDSLELIERQRDDDIDLMRAQLVLVSDGQSTIDPALLVEAQERLDVPVRVSVIALGGDNSALRDFAAHQRHQGLRVLYHHVPDEQLANEADTHDLWRPQPSADPERDFPGELPARVSILPEDLREYSDAWAAHSAQPSELDEGDRAKLEYANRELHALRTHFDRLFPVGPPSRVDASEAERLGILDALAIVLEVVSLTRSDVDQHKVDAIAVLERLLRDRGISPTRYLEIVRSHDSALADCIVGIRAACSHPSERVRQGDRQIIGCSDGTNAT